MNRNDNKYGKASAIVGMVLAVMFIIFWTFSATMIGAPFIFPVFGVGMLIIVVLQFVGGMKAYQAQEERRKEREQRRYEDNLFKEEYNAYKETKDKLGFCPFCGAKVERSFNYCPKCGNHIQ